MRMVRTGRKAGGEVGPPLTRLHDFFLNSGLDDCVNFLISIIVKVCMEIIFVILIVVIRFLCLFQIGINHFGYFIVCYSRSFDEIILNNRLVKTS